MKTLAMKKIKQEAGCKSFHNILSIYSEKENSKTVNENFQKNKKLFPQIEIPISAKTFLCLFFILKCFTIFLAIHSNKYLLRAYYASSTVLGSGNTFRLQGAYAQKNL